MAEAEERFHMQVGLTEKSRWDSDEQVDLWGKARVMIDRQREICV
jgi:hypothetical protein